MLPVSVLIVADNAEVAQIQAGILRHRSISSVVYHYGPMGNNVKFPKKYDLVLVDNHDSSNDAIALVRQLRPECTRPLLLFTFINDVRYQLDAYSAGVDECVLKPTSELLFLAKVTAWLRQSRAIHAEETSFYANDSKISYNGLTLDPQSRQVLTQEGHSVRLSVQEFRLLQIFLSNHGHVLETNQLLRKIWDYEDVDARLLTNLVYRLRNKLATTSTNGDHIKTIDRIGYMYE